MLILTPPQRTAVFLARMVMPFSRSRSPESIDPVGQLLVGPEAPSAQQCVDERRLAVVDVGHDGHVPDVIAVSMGVPR